MSEPTIRELLLLQVTLLAEIRDTLVQGVTAAEAEADTCSHPEEQRINFSTMNDPNHWVCKVCKYDSKGITTN